MRAACSCAVRSVSPRRDSWCDACAFSRSAARLCSVTSERERAMRHTGIRAYGHTDRAGRNHPQPIAPAPFQHKGSERRSIRAYGHTGMRRRRNGHEKEGCGRLRTRRMRHRRDAIETRAEERRPEERRGAQRSKTATARPYAHDAAPLYTPRACPSPLAPRPSRLSRPSRPYSLCRSLCPPIHRSLLIAHCSPVARRGRVRSACAPRRVWSSRPLGAAAERGPAGAAPPPGRPASLGRGRHIEGGI